MTLLLGNDLQCARRLQSSWHVQYSFPRWWIKQRFLPQRAFLATIKPSKIVLEVPRVVDPLSPVFEYALIGNVDGLRKLFGEGKASPSDINAVNGRTLLHVCLLRGF